MHILLLVIQYPPDVNSSGILMAQIAGGLQQRGHQVSVITTFPHYAKFTIWPEYRRKLFQREQEQGIDVLRTYVYAPGTKQNMIHRLLSYLSFNVLAAIAGALSRKRIDIILAPNGSFFTGMAAAFIGLLRGAAFVYNVQDVYPDVPVRAGQLTNRHAIAALEWMEQLMYRKAAQISVISPSIHETLIAKGVAAEKIAVIPNFVDANFIRPLPKDNEFSRRHGLAEKFIVCHAGNLGLVYDLETMLEAAALLREEQGIEFLIVGDGVAKHRLVQKAQALGLPNIRFLPFQDREELPWLRASCDVHVSLYKHGAAAESMPSKVYEIMASGRPLLASAESDSDVWNLVHSNQCGLCVEPEHTQQLVESIQRLYHNPELRATMGRNGRHHAEQHFSCAAVVDKYEALLEQATLARTLNSREGHTIP